MSEQYSAAKPTPKLLGDRTFSPASIQGGNVSRARVSITNNCIAIAADTGGERWTNAYLPIVEWEMFAMAVQQAVVSKEPIHLTVDISKGRQGQAVLDAILGVGRDEEGILFLSVAAPNAREVRFTFMPNHNYRWKANGQEMTSNEISRRNAQAWVNGVNRVLPLDFQAHFAAYEGGNGRQGGGGGGNFGGQKKQWGNQKKQWGGNGGGNYNGGGNNNYPKKQYNNQGGGNNNYNGGGNNGYNGGGQQNYQQQAPQQQQYTPPAPASVNFEEYVGQLP